MHSIVNEKSISFRVVVCLLGVSCLAALTFLLFQSEPIKIEFLSHPVSQPVSVRPISGEQGIANHHFVPRKVNTQDLKAKVDAMNFEELKRVERNLSQEVV
jgi:hypothetical protein